MLNNTEGDKCWGEVGEALVQASVVTRKWHTRHILEEIWCCQVREKHKLNFIKQGLVLSGSSGW